jgi:hypothetical protein
MELLLVQLMLCVCVDLYIFFTMCLGLHRSLVLLFTFEFIYVCVMWFGGDASGFGNRWSVKTGKKNLKTAGK